MANLVFVVLNLSSESFCVSKFLTEKIVSIELHKSMNFSTNNDGQSFGWMCKSRLIFWSDF